MKGIEHLIIAAIFGLFLIIGNILPDIDHTCDLQTRFKAFFGAKDCGARSILHEPLVIFSMMVGFLGVGIGILLHILMDFVFGL